MNRSVFALLLAAALAVAPSGRTRAEPPIAALVGPPPESLRGELVDVGDPWSSARLLVYFGENARAYEILRARSAAGLFDLRAERFEARLLTEMGLYERADSLLALQTHITSPRTYYLHWLQRARLCTLYGNYERALDFIGRLDGLEDAVFEPYRDLVAVEALLRIQRPLDACERAAERISKGIPLSLTPEFERRLLEAYVDGGRLAEALEFLENLKKRTSELSRLSAVVAREVDVRFTLGDTLGAVEAAFELAKTGRASNAAEAIANVLTRVPPGNLPGEVLLEFAGVLLKHKRAAEAERLMIVLQGRTMEGLEDERRRLLSAEILYAEKRYSAADGEAEGRFTDSSLERTAKLLRARIYRGAGQQVRSAEAYEGFAAAFPYDSKAPEALYVAWDLQRETGNALKAAHLLRRIVETYPGHKYARWATVRMALDDVERKEYTRGARVLEQALDRLGRDDPGFLYYLADIYGRMGKSRKKANVIAEIALLNPVSFYLDPRIPSSFVLPDLSNDGTAAPDGSETFLHFLERVYIEREGAYDRIRSILEPWGDPSVLGESAVYLIRGRAFLQMGFRDWGEEELRTVESKEKLPPRACLEIGALYDDFAMPWRSVRLFQRVYYSLEERQRRAFDRDFDLLMYPTPFPSLVFENCLRHGMSPHLVYGMMREESRFDDKAVSGAGAVGLMQIMPETGGQIAEELGFPKGVRMNLLAPEVNLAFGISYASRLIERSDADPLMMLAAYNAGFGNAKKWFGKENAKKSPVEQVDGIDYWETRDYVKRIVESARLYHVFYFSPAVSTGERPSP